MSYCFIFSNIYLKIFFMIKVYGCEKNEDKKKTPKIERLLLGKDFAKSSTSISTLWFFLFKKYFCFSKPKLDLDKYFFKSLFSSLLYDKKKYLFRNVKFYIKYGVHVFIVVGINSY